MRGAGNPVVEKRADPVNGQPTDAVICIVAACVWGSDLWPYRGHGRADGLLMGHEYVGQVEEIGSAVTTLKPGD